MIAVLFAVAPLALHAQVADTAAFPPVPSVVPTLLLPPDLADSGFGAWRRIPIPRHDKLPAAWTMRAGNWDFLVGTPRAMDAMDSSRIIDTTLANCRKPLNLSEADSARVASARPWAPFDSLADDRPVFVISIMPVLRNFTECGWKNLGRPAMIRRGLRFVTQFEYDPRRDPTSAVLLSRLRIVKPTQLARAPVMVMAKGGAPDQRTDQIRLYIPFDAIAPGLTGDMPQTELLIWTKAGGEPDHIVMPGNIMHIIWWEYLHWRAARLATRDRATSAAPSPAAVGVVLRVPSPSDDGLKTAIRQQRAGRFSESATLTLERLTDEKLSVNDRRIALMSMANSFQVDDDAPAAAFVANELTAMDPCALSGSGAPGGPKVGNEAYTGLRNVGAMLDHTRTGVRCTSYAPGATLLRGLLIPGYGQYKTWSHLFGLSATALTVAGACRVVRVRAVGRQLVLALSAQSLGLRAARLHDGGEPAQEREHAPRGDHRPVGRDGRRGRVAGADPRLAPGGGARLLVQADRDESGGSRRQRGRARRRVEVRVQMMAAGRASLERASRRFAIARRLGVPVGVVILVAAVACGDPYTHTNPYDPVVAVTVEVAGPDTLFSYHELGQYSAQSIPAFPDSAFRFGATDTLALVQSVPGGFLSMIPPLYPQTQTVRVMAMLGQIDTIIHDQDISQVACPPPPPCRGPDCPPPPCTIVARHAYRLAALRVQERGPDPARRAHPAPLSRGPCLRHAHSRGCVDRVGRRIRCAQLQGRGIQRRQRESRRVGGDARLCDVRGPRLDRRRADAGRDTSGDGDGAEVRHDLDRGNARCIARLPATRGAMMACRISGTLGVVLLVLASACGNPYERTNPYDPAYPVTISIAGPDTLFSAEQVGTWSVQTVPAFPDTAFRYDCTDSIVFPPAGSGSFRSHAPPLYPATRTVTVTGGVGSIDTMPPFAGSVVGPSLMIKIYRHSASKVIVLTQLVTRIQLRCPDTHACDAVPVGGTWSVWVDGTDALNQQIIALHSSTANPATGTPVATFATRDPTIASVSPVGIRAANVTALKTGTTWIVATRGTLLDSLQLVVR